MSAAATLSSPSPLPHAGSWFTRLRTALDALKILAKENENPEHARRLHLAMDHETYTRLADRLRQTEDGRRLLEQRPSLPGGRTLEELEAMPEGTLGHAWARYYKDLGIHPLDYHFPVVDDADYLTKRYRETHDIHHVLTGYDIDHLGEIELQAFYLGNLGLKNAGLIVSTWVVGQFFELPLREVPQSTRRVFAAYRRGRAAPIILGAWFEEAWEQPVEALTAEHCPRAA